MSDREPRPKKELSVSEAGRKGGRATAERYGSEHYERIGRLGGSRVRQLIERGRQALDGPPSPPSGGSEGE